MQAASPEADTARRTSSVHHSMRAWQQTIRQISRATRVELISDNCTARVDLCLPVERANGTADDWFTHVVVISTTLIVGLARLISTLVG
jgi:hypothetical protein